MHHIESFQQLGALYTRFHLQPKQSGRRLEEMVVCREGV